MDTEVEALKQFFAAINLNDMQAITTYFHPQIVRIEPEGFPTAGTYRGMREVQEHVAEGRGTWAEGSCEPEKFLLNGGKVVVYLHARVRLKDSIDWVDGRFADGFVFREGKIIQYLSFGERTDALSWAGIEDRVEKVVELTAPISRVWQALTDHLEFGEWFRVKLDGPFEPGEVSTGKMTFPGSEGLPWRVVVDRMEPERLFSFYWDLEETAGADAADQPTMLVEFGLSPTAIGTRLTITESGFSAIPHPRRAEILRRNMWGWEVQSRNIAAHVASGA